MAGGVRGAPGDASAAVGYLPRLVQAHTEHGRRAYGYGGVMGIVQPPTEHGRSANVVTPMPWRTAPKA